MLPTRVAVLFDNRQRPETTGGYCLRALQVLTDAVHFLPDQLPPRDGFDLYLRIDDGLDYQLPAGLRPNAWWAIDTHLGFDRCLAQSRDCDLTFAAQRDGAERLRRAGIANAVWLPLACDPAIHRPHAVPKEFEFAFVGNIFPGARTELLDLLRRRYPKHFVGNRYFEEMAKTYSAAKVVFNRSIRNDVNMRVFEALACGSLLLTNDLIDNGQADLFADCVHLAAYRDADELLDKLAFYRAHPEARARVEAAGLAEVVGKHTYRHRMETILAAASRLPTTVAVASPNPVPTGYDPSYFEFARPELLDLVPTDAKAILDVGCGAGRFGEALKTRQQCRVTGLELDPAAAAAARARLDEVHEGDIEAASLSLPESSFDAAVCGDVLEHLRDPLAFLRRLRGWLTPAGTLVASVPNVRHHTVVRSLLEGNWTYEPAGLLDRTHLRFFTRRELEKLLYRGGFAPQSLAIVPGAGYEEWAAAGKRGEVKIGRLHIGGLDPAEAEEFHAYQYLVTARPAPAPEFGLTSIVILTHNELGYTRQCVDSLRLVTDEPFELICVDNGSTDGTPDHLRALAAADPRVKVIANSDNRGFPAGCNQGIAASTGGQVLLLNNDTLLTTGWLGRMLHTLHADPKIGLVGPCTDNVSGEQAVPTKFDGIEGLDGFAWDWGKRHHRQTEETDRLVGFCLLIKREVIEQIGILDERFGVGCYDDDDYCRRALAAGFRAVIARDTFIHHAGGATFRGAGIDFAGLMRENEQRYRQKWEARPEPTMPIEPEPAFELEIGPDGGLLLVPPKSKPSPAPKVPRPIQNASTSAPPTLLSSLCMIVRNNERTIAAALESIKPYVDEMIVVDTGSTDQTPQICERLGARVYHFPWCDDFSAARNESIKYARGKWIFWMDSDDVIDKANGKALCDLIHGPHDPNVFGYSMQVHCPGKGGDDGITVVDHIKLFRNLPQLRFEGRIHEQILMPIRRAGGEVGWTDLFVVHSGYDRSPEGQRRKLERDFRLLQLDLAERPDHPFVLFNLGMTHADCGQHAQAVDWLRRCIAVSEPGATHLRKAHAWLVGSLSALGQKDEAMQQCAAGLTMFPLDDELRFWKGRLLHESGRPNDAAAAYRDLLVNAEERHFTSVDRGLRGHKARQNLALVLEELGDLAGAEREWRAVLDAAPYNRVAWRSLGELLLKADKTLEAKALVEQLTSDPKLAAEGAILAARLAMHFDDRNRARQMLEEAALRWSDDTDLLREFARVLYEHFSVSEGEPIVQRLLEHDPEDGSAWYNLGMARLLSGRHDQAVAAFRQSLTYRLNVPATLVDLGRALYSGGRPEEAVRSWEHALRLAPGHPVATDLLRQAGRL